MSKDLNDAIIQAFSFTGDNLSVKMINEYRSKISKDLYKKNIEYHLDVISDWYSRKSIELGLSYHDFDIRLQRQSYDRGDSIIVHARYSPDNEMQWISILHKIKEESSKLSHENSDMKFELQRQNNLSFWERLKFLFTGKLPIDDSSPINYIIGQGDSDV